MLSSSTTTWGAHTPGCGFEIAGDGTSSCGLFDAFQEVETRECQMGPCLTYAAGALLTAKCKGHDHNHRHHPIPRLLERWDPRIIDAEGQRHPPRQDSLKAHMGLRAEDVPMPKTTLFSPFMGDRGGACSASCRPRLVAGPSYGSGRAAVCGSFGRGCWRARKHRLRHRAMWRPAASEFQAWALAHRPQLAQLNSPCPDQDPSPQRPHPHW